jgi:hypothetical protein
MKVCGGVDVQVHIFLIFILIRGLWSASYPGCFMPGEEPLVSIGQKVRCGSGTGLDNMER